MALWNLKHPLKGAYIKQKDSPPVIVLAPELFDNPKLFRVVMAEELGHHFMTTGNTIITHHHSYYDRLLISIEEFKARKWAAKFLIPGNILAKLLGTMETKDLAETFMVTEEFMEFRLKLLNRNKPEHNITVGTPHFLAREIGWLRKDREIIYNTC